MHFTQCSTAPFHSFHSSFYLPHSTFSILPTASAGDAGEAGNDRQLSFVAAVMPAWAKAWKSLSDIGIHNVCSHVWPPLHECSRCVLVKMCSFAVMQGTGFALFVCCIVSDVWSLWHSFIKSMNDTLTNYYTYHVSPAPFVTKWRPYHQLENLTEII